MPRISKSVNEAIEAVSIRYNNLVYELKQKGERVIVLSLGEAYFDVPLERFDDLPFPDLYHYSHSRGIDPLRKKIAEYYERSFQVKVDPATEIMVTTGSKAAIYFALNAVLDPGCEAIVQEPMWVSYPEQVKLLHGVPVCLPYNASIREYERYITEKTRVIILNNPHNPRGEVLKKSDLEYLLELARAHDIYLLADEAYSDFDIEGQFTSLGALDSDKQNIIICNSISKNFGISGWRLGYTIAGKEITSQILKLQQHIVTCPATILQHYVSDHFDKILETCRPQIRDLTVKRREVAKILDRLGLESLPGTTTFYYFISIAPTKLTSEEFCMRLLQERKVSAVPGSGYGQSCDAFIRVSFGTETLADIQTGLERIKGLIDATS